jgi:hypothetical protein
MCFSPSRRTLLRELGRNRKSQSKGVSLATSTSGEGQVQARPRKRLLILAVISGFLYFTGWLIFRDRSMAVIRLPDGRRFTIKKLTYGKDHSYEAGAVTLTPIEVWANQLLSRIGREIIPKFSMRKRVETPTSQLGAWLNRDGWRTAINTSPSWNNAAPTAGPSLDPTFLNFQLPPESSAIKFELLSSTGSPLGSTTIQCDIPIALPQNWNVDVLPVSETIENMRVTLKGLTADWVKSAETPLDVRDILAVIPEYVVEIDGVESRSWSVMTDGEPLIWYPVDGRLTIASIESRLGTSVPLDQCTVSPHDIPWKVHLPIVCKNPDEVSEGDRITLASISLDDGLQAVPEASIATTIGRAKIKFLGAGRAGSFIYEGAGESDIDMAMKLPLEMLSRQRLKGTFQSTRNPTPASAVSGSPGAVSFTVSGMNTQRPKYPIAIHLDFTSPRPHIAVSAIDLDGRYPVMIVMDENGNRVDGELVNAGGLLVWVAGPDCSDIQRVNVTLTLQNPRRFAFVVPPPTFPARATPTKMERK